MDDNTLNYSNNLDSSNANQYKHFDIAQVTNRAQLTKKTLAKHA